MFISVDVDGQVDNDASIFKISRYEMTQGAIRLKRVMFLLLSLVASSAVFAMAQFQTAADAQMHCPHDTVVWLNLPTMIWHTRGERWYGRTKHGAYVCEKEAAAEGARASRNGE